MSSLSMLSVKHLSVGAALLVAFADAGSQTLQAVSTYETKQIEFFCMDRGKAVPAKFAELRTELLPPRSEALCASNQKPVVSAQHASVLDMAVKALASGAAVAAAHKFIVFSHETSEAKIKERLLQYELPLAVAEQAAPKIHAAVTNRKTRLAVIGTAFASAGTVLLTTLVPAASYRRSESESVIRTTSAPGSAARQASGVVTAASAP